ncbi:MAG: L-2-amino-thiazoline-4-carboxylic acid hydrolase [Dehalococcoidia bacterium]
MAELSPEERLRRTVAGDSAIIAVLARAVNDKYGAEGLEALREAIENEFPRMFAAVGKQIGARVGDGDAADWAKIEQHVSGMSGVELEVEASPHRAVLRVKSCPRAEQYRRVFPDFCRLVFIGMERAIARAVNPKLEVHGEKTLPGGDDCCEIHCQLPE